MALQPDVTESGHLVSVVAPSVTVRPRGGVKVVEAGEEVVLECRAHGYPKPTVTWTKKVSWQGGGGGGTTGSDGEPAGAERFGLGVMSDTAISVFRSFCMSIVIK